ncbi:UNVERIFIED_CONTAM: MAM domain-containing glycosylphosphatidylinositol anchor protein 2 [Gekko kuhli]
MKDVAERIRIRWISPLKSPPGSERRAPKPCYLSTQIGTLNVYLRLKGQTGLETPFWSSSGNKGQQWFQARMNIQPNTSFQVIFEGIRGRGMEGDIAIDDISIVEGECTKPDYINNHIPSGAVRTLPHIRIFPLFLLMSVLSHQR